MLKMLIQLGKADVIVCGGSEAAVTASGVGGFNALMALLQEMMTQKQHLDHLTKTVMVLFLEKEQVVLFLKNMSMP